MESEDPSFWRTLPSAAVREAVRGDTGDLEPQPGGKEAKR